VQIRNPNFEIRNKGLNKILKGASKIKVEKQVKNTEDSRQKTEGKPKGKATTKTRKCEDSKEEGVFFKFRAPVVSS